MAENSRSQVTITLGRSGQVVKRAGAVLDNELSEPIPTAGSKRSVRDRLGSSVDAVQLDNKRLRGDNGRWSLKTSKYMDDLHLSKDDLRFKIMKRTQSNIQHHNTMDLRDILSRRARPSMSNPVTFRSLQEARPEISPERRRIPEPRDRPPLIPEQRIGLEPRGERPRGLEPRGEKPRGLEPRGEKPRGLEPRSERPRVLEPKGDRSHGLDPRYDRPRGPESRDDRSRIGEPRGLPEPLEVRHCVAKLTNGNMATGQFASMRPSEGPSQMDFLRNSYSSWTLDQIRRKSPDRSLNTSRGLSPPPPPPPGTEELQRRRTYEDSRSVAYLDRDVNEISRPMTTTSFATKPCLSVGPTKSIAPLAASPLPPASNSMQRNQYSAQHVTVEGFLRSLGLEKYVISFKVEEVDMAALSQMGDQDLKELGIPMGPRKKILLALLARTRRQPR